MVFSRGAVLDGRVDGASTACKRDRARRRRFASVRELPKLEQKTGLLKPKSARKKLLLDVEVAPRPAGIERALVRERDVPGLPPLVGR